MILRGVTFIGDTITLRTSGGASLKSFDGQSSTSVLDGSMLVREFQHDGNTFVRLPSTPPRFGWVSLAAGEWSRKRSAPESTADILEQLLPAVRSIVADANAALRTIYRKLAADGAATARPPWFALQENPDAVLCTFMPDTRVADFRGSIGALAQTLDRLFPEGSVRVTVKNNVITLLPL
jgi:hypothetical protein